jgi:hypothetical protein
LGGILFGLLSGFVPGLGGGEEAIDGAAQYLAGLSNGVAPNTAEYR